MTLYNELFSPKKVIVGAGMDIGWKCCFGAEVSNESGSSWRGARRWGSDAG